MKITRTHPHNGEEITLNIKVTTLELQALEMGDNIPHLSSAEVAFIQTGLPPQDQDDYRGSEDYYEA